VVKLSLNKAWSRDSLFLHDTLSQFFTMSDVAHWAELKTIMTEITASLAAGLQQLLANLFRDRTFFLAKQNQCV
jgi:hypothetical protein